MCDIEAPERPSQIEPTHGLVNIYESQARRRRSYTQSFAKTDQQCTLDQHQPLSTYLTYAPIAPITTTTTTNINSPKSTSDILNEFQSEKKHLITKELNALSALKRLSEADDLEEQHSLGISSTTFTMGKGWNSTRSQLPQHAGIRFQSLHDQKQQLLVAIPSKPYLDNINISKTGFIGPTGVNRRDSFLKRQHATIGLSSTLDAQQQVTSHGNTMNSSSLGINRNLNRPRVRQIQKDYKLASLIQDFKALKDEISLTEPIYTLDEIPINQFDSHHYEGGKTVKLENQKNAEHIAAYIQQRSSQVPSSLTSFFTLQEQGYQNRNRFNNKLENGAIGNNMNSCSENSSTTINENTQCSSGSINLDRNNVKSSETRRMSSQNVRVGIPDRVSDSYVSLDSTTTGVLTDIQNRRKHQVVTVFDATERYDKYSQPLTSKSYQQTYAFQSSKTLADERYHSEFNQFSGDPTTNTCNNRNNNKNINSSACRGNSLPSQRTNSNKENLRFVDSNNNNTLVRLARTKDTVPLSNIDGLNKIMSQERLVSRRNTYCLANIVYNNTTIQSQQHQKQLQLLNNGYNPLMNNNGSYNNNNNYPMKLPPYLHQQKANQSTLPSSPQIHTAFFPKQYPSKSNMPNRSNHRSGVSLDISSITGILTREVNYQSNNITALTTDAPILSKSVSKKGIISPSMENNTIAERKTPTSSSVTSVERNNGNENPINDQSNQNKGQYVSQKQNLNSIGLIGNNQAKKQLLRLFKNNNRTIHSNKIGYREQYDHKKLIISSSKTQSPSKTNLKII